MSSAALVRRCGWWEQKKTNLCSYEEQSESDYNIDGRHASQPQKKKDRDERRTLRAGSASFMLRSWQNR